MDKNHLEKPQLNQKLTKLLNNLSKFRPPPAPVVVPDDEYLPPASHTKDADGYHYDTPANGLVY